MAQLDCTHDDSIDGAGNFVSYSDASADFGDGAIVVSCPCGGWLIEDEAGRVVARSSAEIVVALAQAA